MIVVLVSPPRTRPKRDDISIDKLTLRDTIENADDLFKYKAAAKDVSGGK